MLPEARRELVEAGLVEVPPRLVGIGLDLRDLDPVHVDPGRASRVPRANRRTRGERRAEPTKKIVRTSHFHAAFAALHCDSMSAHRPAMSFAGAHFGANFERGAPRAALSETCAALGMTIPETASPN